MDGFTWWVLLSKWAKESGFSPLATAFIALGVAVLVYLGKIFKGIKAGYGVILQDQKDASTSLRDQLTEARQNCKELEAALESERNAKLSALAMLTQARVRLTEHGIPIIEVK